jgi:hypothetical protein
VITRLPPGAGRRSPRHPPRPAPSGRAASRR